MIQDSSSSSSDTATCADKFSDKNLEYSLEDVEGALMKSDKQEVKNALIVAKLPVTDMHIINVKNLARSLM